VGAGRLPLDLALAEGFVQLRRGVDLMEIATSLKREYPDSDTAFVYCVNALRLLKRWQEVDKMVDDRIARNPNDMLAYSLGANVAMAGGNLRRAEELETKLMALGRNDAAEANNLAWDYFVEGRNLEEATEIARKAASSGTGGGYAVLHTLACLYAETGKTTEARQTILNAMESVDMREPNDSSWFVFARIAEQFGLTDVARDYYGRIAKPEREDGFDLSTYALAQKRIKGLK
jgi:tetratricopeptide (TPR) repeat protein